MTPEQAATIAYLTYVATETDLAPVITCFPPDDDHDTALLLVNDECAWTVSQSGVAELER